jgi:hypothetical protein
MVINPLRRVTGFDTSGFWGARQGSTAGEHGRGARFGGARFGEHGRGARWGARFGEHGGEHGLSLWRNG